MAHHRTPSPGYNRAREDVHDSRTTDDYSNDREHSRNQYIQAAKDVDDHSKRRKDTDGYEEGDRKEKK